MPEGTTSATSVSSASSEKPEAQRTEELIQYSGPHDPADYDVPAVTTSDEQRLYTQNVVRTAENAQQMYLDDKIDEEELARAVGMFGRPANPSEVINRPDASYTKKLPKWVFSPPEGLGLTLEQRLEEANKYPENKETKEKDNG